MALSRRAGYNAVDCARQKERTLRFMAILTDTGKLRRHLAAFLALVFTILVVATTIMPHFHDCKDARPSAITRSDGHSLSAAVGFCPVCDWLASSCVPAAAPAAVHGVPILTRTPITPRILVYRFGLVEPLHSPQRGPPCFSHFT